MMQPEEVREPEQTEQSSTSLEDVPRPQGVPETILTPPMVPAPAPPRGARTSTKVSPKLHRSRRLNAPLERYGDEVLLLDNDKLAAYKEAIMGPESVKWLNNVKSEI
jgi:hypothetical protein